MCKKNYMKLTLIPTLLAFSFFGFIPLVAFAQEAQVDSGLLRDIVRGHQLLSQYTECLAGEIECFRGSSEAGKLEFSSGRRFLFFRDKDLLRLEYVDPRKDTEIFPGHEKNDVTRVIMRSKDHYFRYMAVGTTGVPYANLWKSTESDEASEMTFNSDFYSNINALLQPGAITGVKVSGMLQDKIGSIETRKYNDVPDALWIRGIQRVEGGYVSQWTIVLNPKQHYALLFDEMRTENSKTGFLATSSRTVTSQVTDDGKILPKEIVFKGQTRALTNGQKQEVNTGKRTLVSIFTTDKPDDRLFTEESFKDLGRDYAVVNVLPNQKHADGGHVVSAAPLSSRLPYYPVDDFSKQEWSWISIILLSTGILLTAVGGLRLYFQWQRSKKQKQ
jgi:hypothetical protein